MIDSPSADSFEISDYVGVLRRRWKVIAAWTLIGTMAAAAYLVVGPKAYTATASVYVTSNAANTEAVLGSKTTTVINMDNEAQIVTSTSVAKVAMQALHSPLTPQAIVKQVAVTIPANTQILQISCSDSTPRKAAVCANAFANAYLATRQATAAAKVTAEIKADQAREKTLETRSLKLQAQISGLKSGSAQATAAHESLANIVTQLSPLRSAIAALGASNNYQAGYIITAASRPGTPSSPRKLLYGPGGLMAGLLIGLILAFLVDRGDDRIHSAQEVERFLRIPALLTMTKPPATLWSALPPPSSVPGREFGELARTTASTLGDGAHVILVVGASPTSWTSVVAANLAAALARTRSNAVLVYTSTQESRAPALLGVSASVRRGFADLAVRAAAATQVAQQSSVVPELKVVAPGTDTGALEDVQYDAARRAMVALKDDAHYVIIDAGNAEGGISGLAEFADAAILVAEIGNTTVGQVAECAKRLHRLRTDVLGAAVLPELDRASRAASQAKGVADGRLAGLPEGSARAAASERSPGRTVTPQADMERRATYSPAADETASRDQRVAGQTWPLPRASGPAADQPAGRKPERDYPADFAAGREAKDI
jgi:capsular polysaccharide biosynthesis protein/MinD-like ATPase involved in chromosome partitioning or flagellar assembly